MDLQKEFNDIIIPYTDIPLLFIEGGIYSISARCFGQFFIISKSRRKRPNLYMIFSSAPGVGRRGDLLSYINKVVLTAIDYYSHETKIDDASIKNMKIAQMLEGGSPEGLADKLAWLREREINNICLSSSEMGRIFSAIQNAHDYMSDYDKILCKVWSGEPLYDCFSKRGKKSKDDRYVEEGTYFNICSTMQKIKNYFNGKMSQTGFVRRLLINSIDGSDIKDWKAPMGYDDDNLHKELNEFGKRIGTVMIGYASRVVKNKCKLLDLVPTQDVIDRINKYAEHWDKLVREDDENPYYLYQQTRWEYAAKVSGNCALLHGKTCIDISDVEKSIPFIDARTKDIRTELEKQMILPKMRDRENHLQKIMKYFSKGLTNKETQQRMIGYGIHAENYNEYKKILLEDGKIKINKNGGFDVIDL